MERKLTKEYSTPLPEYNLDLNENKIRTEFSECGSEISTLSSEYYSTAATRPQNAKTNKRQKKNLLMQVAAVLGAVTIVYSVSTKPAVPTVEIKYYPELVPILTTLQGYVAQQEIENWEEYVLDHSEFLLDYTEDKVGWLAFDGETCYTLTNNPKTDSTSMLISFSNHDGNNGENVRNITKVQICFGDFSGDTLNGDVTYATLRQTNRGDYLPLYAYTQWNNSKLIGNYHQEESDLGYSLTDHVYGTIGPKEHLTGTLIFENESSLEHQELHVDENGCLILDDCICDQRDSGYIFSEDNWELIENISMTGHTYEIENSITGEVQVINNEGKPLVLWAEKNEERESVRLLTCHLWYEYWDYENRELISTTTYIQSILKKYFD